MTTIHDIPDHLLIYLISVAMPETRHIRRLELISRRFKLASRQRTVVMLDEPTYGSHLSRYSCLRLILGRVIGVTNELIDLKLPFLETDNDGDIHTISQITQSKYPIICHRRFIRYASGTEHQTNFVYYRNRLRIIGHHHHWWNIVEEFLGRGLSFSFRGRDEDRDLNVEISTLKPNMETVTIIIRRFGSVCDIGGALRNSGAKKILIDYRAYDPSIQEMKNNLKKYANFDYSFIE